MRLTDVVAAAAAAAAGIVMERGQVVIHSATEEMALTVCQRHRQWSGGAQATKCDCSAKATRVLRGV